MEVTYSRQARKILLRIPRSEALRIRERILLLSENPERSDLDIKRLRGRDGYRLRVGQWRILFARDAHMLAIEYIGPRGDVYK